MEPVDNTPYGLLAFLLIVGVLVGIAGLTLLVGGLLEWSGPDKAKTQVTAGLGLLTLSATIVFFTLDPFIG